MVTSRYSAVYSKIDKFDIQLFLLSVPRLSCIDFFLQKTNRALYAEKINSTSYLQR